MFQNDYKFESIIDFCFSKCTGEALTTVTEVTVPELRR